MTDDESLLRACRRGDHQAWVEIVRRHERLVYSIPLDFGLSRSDADDVVQTTFAALVRSIDHIDDDNRLGAWLGTVARRQTWRLVERRRRESPTDDNLDQVHTEESAIVRVEHIEWLHQGLDRLNNQCRELLTALYFSGDGVAYSEVAGALAIPVGSIGPTRARCLDKLRAILEALQDQ